MTDAKKPAAAIEPWQVLDSKYSYRDRWLAVRSDTVRVPNGTILSPYHTIEFPEWVCAIALTPQREIVLIEEYRHGIERPSFELPCGTPDDESEDVLEAMQRELLEETDWSKFGRGKNPKCENCMAHCGYEPTAVAQTGRSFKEIVRAAFAH